MYIKTNQLPQSLQSALQSLGFNKADIKINAKEFTRLENPAYGDGYQSSVTLVNLETGARQTIEGSWGGSNPWQTRENAQVDGMGNQNEVPLIAGLSAVVKAQRGGNHPTSATIEVHPNTLLKLLPASEVQLTETQKGILKIIRSYTSAGRKDEFQRSNLGTYGPEHPEIKILSEQGFLKITKAGAISITTEGKNMI